MRQRFNPWATLRLLGYLLVVLIKINITTAQRQSLIYPNPMILGRKVTLYCDFSRMRHTGLPLNLIKNVKEISISMLSDRDKMSVPRFVFSLFPTRVEDKRVFYTGQGVNMTLLFNGSDTKTENMRASEIIRLLGVQVTFENAICDLAGVIEFKYKVLGPPQDFYYHALMTKYRYLDLKDHRPFLELNPKKAPRGLGYTQRVTCKVISATKFVRLHLMFKGTDQDEFHLQITNTTLVGNKNLHNWPENPAFLTRNEGYWTCRDRLTYIHKVWVQFKVSTTMMRNIEIMCSADFVPKARLPTGSVVQATEKYRLRFRLNECVTKACNRYNFGNLTYQIFDSGESDDFNTPILERRTKELLPKGGERENSWGKYLIHTLGESTLSLVVSLIVLSVVILLMAALIFRSGNDSSETRPLQ